MTDREKLIELIGGTHYGKDNGSTIGRNFQSGFIEKIADQLIANGVMVQQWISVEEMLPPEPMEYIAVIKGGGNATTLLFDGVLWFEEDPEGWRTYYAVSHWMPLPQPPREE